MNNFKYVILFITFLVLYIASIFSTYVSSVVYNDGIVNENNKKLITPIFVTNFIIQIFFIIYLIRIIIMGGTKYIFLDYIVLLFTIIGIILSLIYIAQRDNQDLVTKNFVYYILYYKLILIFIIFSYVINDYIKCNFKSNTTQNNKGLTINTQNNEKKNDNESFKSEDTKN